MTILDVFKAGVTRREDTGIEMPYIIAEAGVNHEGSMDTAKRLIALAHQGGANAIKFQSYKAGTLASQHSPAYWDLAKEPTRSQFELFKKYDKFWKPEFEALKLECDRVGIEFLSTPFDVESASFLDELMPAFKISSSDITNLPFIEFICSFGKPIILSTGASELDEITEALGWIDGFNVPVALLHCVLNYPTADDDANLGMIPALEREFPDRIIGYSDHTLPRDMRVCEAAVLLGARIIEKHFTHDKTLPGNDHYHAMDVDDLLAFKRQLSRVVGMTGPFVVRSLPGEDTARANARRSLVAARAIPKGKVIDAGDLTWKRPASGVSPKHFREVIGKSAAIHIDKDDILTWEMLSE